MPVICCFSISWYRLNFMSGCDNNETKKKQFRLVLWERKHVRRWICGPHTFNAFTLNEDYKLFVDIIHSSKRDINNIFGAAYNIFLVPTLTRTCKTNKQQKKTWNRSLHRPIRTFHLKFCTLVGNFGVEISAVKFDICWQNGVKNYFKFSREEAEASCLPSVFLLLPLKEKTGYFFLEHLRTLLFGAYRQMLNRTTLREIASPANNKIHSFGDQFWWGETDVCVLN